MTQWKKVKIGDFLTESKILAEESDANHRITVRLNCKGVEKRSLKAEKEGATKYYERKAGQFIYGKQNIHKGAFGVIPKELDGFTSSADLPAFDIDKSKCIPEWLCLCLKVDERYKTLQKDVKGVGSQRLAVNIFLNVEIPLPNLMEQKRIVSEISEKLENIQQLSEEVEKQKAYAKQLRASILQDAIEGKLTANWREKHPVKKGDPDYDAEALFEKIQAEKQEKGKKQKPLPAITEDEKPFEIPEGWKWVKIEQISISVGNRNNQILSKDVKNIGKYPAVSQGQKLIDGYSDDESKVIDDLPLIMFGDHTRNVKFIDFPFVINADGTKFFKMILGTPKYLYYAVLLLSLKIRNRGYARHYSLLKETPFPLPPLAEQNEIVARVEKHLETVTELENQIEERGQQAKQLMQGILKEAFE